jgi:putative membrane protein
MFGRFCAGFPAMHGWGGLGMGIVTLVIVIIAIVVLFRALEANRAKGPSGETPLDILQKRYAKGEVTKEEFDKVKSDLSK